MWFRPLRLWLKRTQARQVRGDRRGRQVIYSAWLERHDLDRWLACDGLRRIADELRELRSAAAGDRRDPGLQR
jgi:hypothetical protein